MNTPVTELNIHETNAAAEKFAGAVGQDAVRGPAFNFAWNYYTLTSGTCPGAEDQVDDTLDSLANLTARPRRKVRKLLDKCWDDSAKQCWPDLGVDMEFPDRNSFVHIQGLMLLAKAQEYRPIGTSIIAVGLNIEKGKTALRHLTLHVDAPSVPICDQLRKLYPTTTEEVWPVTITASPGPELRKSPSGMLFQPLVGNAMRAMRRNGEWVEIFNTVEGA